MAGIRREMDINLLIKAYFQAYGKKGMKHLSYCFENINSKNIELLSFMAYHFSYAEDNLQNNSKTMIYKICQNLLKYDLKDRTISKIKYSKIISNLSSCLDLKMQIILWNKMAMHKYAYVRRMYLKKIRNLVTDKYAMKLWNLYLKNDDLDILKNLILSKSSVKLPKEIINEVQDVFIDNSYMISKTISHFLVDKKGNGFKKLFNKYRTCVIYAAGYSGNKALIKQLRKLLNTDNAKDAIWSLGRLKDRNTTYNYLLKAISKIV